MLFDQDGVIAAWEEHFVHRMRERFPHLDVADAGTRDDFNLHAGVSPEVSAAINVVMDEPDFYLNIPVMPGAIEAMKTLTDAGFDVAVCTAPWPTNPTCASQKYAWLLNHGTALFGEEFGRQLVQNAVLTRDKTRVIGDVLIDDKPSITGANATPLWRHIYMTYPYNRDLLGPRIDSWVDDQWHQVIADAVTPFPLAQFLPALECTP